MEEKMGKDIKIYPSNWLYNASVIGFLRSIYDFEKCNVEEWFENNIVSLPRDIFEKLEINNRYFNDNKISSIVGNSPLYRNYINPSRSQDKSGFVDFVNELSKVVEQGQDFCGICSKNFTLLQESKERLNKKWSEYSQSKSKEEKAVKSKGSKKVKESKPEETGFDTFLSNLQRYNVMHNNLIAPSVGEFPNAFWNLKDSILICPLCAYLIIHYHIPFEDAQTKDGQIFINAPSFKVMWHLNKFAKELLSKNRSYQLREILGISLIEFAQRFFVTLGAWSIMNIEMVIKKGTKIDSYSLPYEISRLLLQKEIASLISATKEPLVLEIILNGKFDYLLTLANKVLRCSFTGKNANDDKYISKLINNWDTQGLKNLAKVLPELYAKINSTLNREVMI